MNILINLKYTLAVTAGVCSSFAYAQKHPHIILIMTDQLLYRVQRYGILMKNEE